MEKTNNCIDYYNLKMGSYEKVLDDYERTADRMSQYMEESKTLEDEVKKECLYVLTEFLNELPETFLEIEENKIMLDDAEEISRYNGYLWRITEIRKRLKEIRRVLKSKSDGSMCWCI